MSVPCTEIDYRTSAKEETDTTSEPVSVALKMIANVSTGTPNILLQNAGFRSWVNQDLVGAYRAALDYHITTEIASATTTPSSGGSNAFEDVLYAQEAVRAAGYAPDLCVISPGGRAHDQLLQMTKAAIRTPSRSSCRAW